MDSKQCCAKCNKNLPDDDLVITCSACANKYHHSSCCSLSDVTYRAMSAMKKAAWKCADCKKCDAIHVAASKQLSSEKSPHLAISDTSKRYMNDHMKTSMEENQKTLREINQKLSNLEDLKVDIAGINKYMELLNKKIDELHQQNKEKDAKIQQLEQKVSVIPQLEERLNRYEQHMIKNNAEISNVPKEIDAMQAVLLLAKEVGVALEERDISDAYRKKKTGKIIAKFHATTTKQKFLKQCKAKRLKSADIWHARKENTPNEVIYVNDELTPFFMKLLWVTKRTAKEKNWKYVWVKEGNVLVKKDEDSKVFLIHNEEDLTKMF